MFNLNINLISSLIIKTEYEFSVISHWESLSIN